ncbi:MAG: preprotein translocase subunit SecG [Candidatus Acidoferrales bacterium]
MSEKVTWTLAGLITAGLLYVGVEFYPPLLAMMHVLVCVLLVMVVLLQSGRAADLAGAFGGAGSQTAFGPRGAASFLSRATTFLAVVFMVTSLTLAIYASSPGRSVAGQAAPEQTEPAEEIEPSEPAPPPQE